MSNDAEPLKICSLCLIKKSISEFGNKRARCKECDKKFKSELKEYINELKSKPCTDCGKKYPHYVMDFDHLDGFTKRANISKLIGERTNVKSILTEISKCELVCANCHRERTHNRLFKAKLHTT